MISCIYLTEGFPSTIYQNNSVTYSSNSLFWCHQRHSPYYPTLFYIILISRKPLWSQSYIVGGRGRVAFGRGGNPSAWCISQYYTRVAISTFLTFFNEDTWLTLIKVRSIRYACQRKMACMMKLSMSKTRFCQNSGESEFVIFFCWLWWDRGLLGLLASDMALLLTIKLNNGAWLREVCYRTANLRSINFECRRSI